MAAVIDMKTVKLTDKEVELLQYYLDDVILCRAECQCGYDDRICGDIDPKTGKYKCKLQRDIEKIQKKLEGEDLS